MNEHARRKTRERVRKHRAVRRQTRVLLEGNAVNFPESCKNAAVVINEKLNYITPEEQPTLIRDQNISDFYEIFSNEVGETEDDFSQPAIHENFLELENEYEQPISPTTDMEEKEIGEIRKWAITRNINQNCLDELLCILRKRLLPGLPKTSKTFLQSSTSCQYNIHEMKDANDQMRGEFVYFGIENGLQGLINTNIHVDNIELQFNIDGMQVFKSGGKHFWPILCKVHFIPDIYNPFIVAIYSGTSKPANVNEYLEKFIKELNDLQKDGILITNRHFSISLKCFICDTPARTYIKCTKGHGGYSACERCSVYGTRVLFNKGYRIVYTEMGCAKRTDISFRQQVDHEHHIGISPLLKIEPPLDLTKIFVLDYMHLLCLGVMKKLLVDFWLGGNLKIKLGRRQREELSRRLDSISSDIPTEFQRKMRSICFVHKWKATEYRFFLLYCGPIVLKNLLPKQQYRHFLLLHVALRILCCDNLALNKTNIAKLYLERFVQALPYLYGQHATVINMHYLIHITDDVENMGCSLSRISSFPFENLLGKIRHLIRTPKLLLSQICRRQQEKSIIKIEKPHLPPPLNIIKHKIQNGIIFPTKIGINESMIATKTPNNLVLMKDGSIVQVTKIFGLYAKLQSMKLEGHIWKIKKSVFQYPCNSKILQSWELTSEPQSSTIEYPLSMIDKKCVKMSFSTRSRKFSKVYVVPLLH